MRAGRAVYARDLAALRAFRDSAAMVVRKKQVLIDTLEAQVRDYQREAALLDKTAPAGQSVSVP